MFENLLPIGAHTPSQQEAFSCSGPDFVCNGGSCSRRREASTVFPNGVPTAQQRPNGAGGPRNGANGPAVGVHATYPNYSAYNAYNAQTFPSAVVDEHKKSWRPSRRCGFGDTSALAIALVTTCVCCAIADAIRTTPPPSSGDSVALGVSTVICVSLALRSIYRMWVQLRPKSDNLQGTLFDVASVYFLTVVAFGTTFAFVGILDGIKTSWLMTNAEPGATLRALDGIYFMTFVAAGIGIPPSRDTTLTLGLHLVTWACSLLSSTFVGKVLIATALSIRFSSETHARYDEEYGYDPETLDEERRPLRRS